METLEVSDLSPHAIVSDYKIPAAYCPDRLPLLPQKRVCEYCGVAPGKPHLSICIIRNAPPPLTGQKHDAGKPPMDLLDRTALEETARVLAFGAKKYAAHQWRQGLSVTRTCAAAIRHLYQFLDGETLDAETGLNHLAHAMCEVMFALNASKTRPDLDDRHGATR